LLNLIHNFYRGQKYPRIFLKWAPKKQSPNRRKFAQSGHPAEFVTGNANVNAVCRIRRLQQKGNLYKQLFLCRTMLRDAARHTVRISSNLVTWRCATRSGLKITVRVNRP
jgi:hypothetical protein